MDIENIVAEVRSIILRHAKPERIWLYGSRANDEASDNSDIDIAYDDKEFKAPWLIEEEVDKLPTLLKIDIKNIAHAEERFRQRVVSTGRVLYSANKRLRFEDGLYNFRRAFERFAEALDKKEILEREGFGDIFLDLAVKRFEFTYEMTWKAIKRYLDYAGIGAMSPRACFKEAFSQHLITEEQIWLEMIERRNLSSHIYNQDEVTGILGRLDDYRKAFQELLEQLEAKTEY
ncbi:MAG: HI0074 family nucleotidyltransferase substrate-binding subunit [Pedobacter sp.]